MSMMMAQQQNFDLGDILNNFAEPPIFAEDDNFTDILNNSNEPLNFAEDGDMFNNLAQDGDIFNDLLDYCSSHSFLSPIEGPFTTQLRITKMQRIMRIHSIREFAHRKISPISLQ